MNKEMINDALKLMGKKGVAFSMEDKEFVLQFAFKSHDMELTAKLVEELCENNKDTMAVKVKYKQLEDKKPDWIDKIENLLVALEMYRIEEEKAIIRITDFLRTRGIDISENLVKNSDIEKLIGLMPDDYSDISRGKTASL